MDSNGISGHWKTDKDVEDFLDDVADQVKSKEEALSVARAFADLRPYRMVETLTEQKKGSLERR